MRFLPFGAASLAYARDRQGEIRFADFAVFAEIADLGSPFSAPKAHLRK